MSIAVAELRGGLGNQLFQVCAALTARNLGFEVLLDEGPLRGDRKRSLAVEGLGRELGIAFGTHPDRRWGWGRKGLKVITDPEREFARVEEQLHRVTGDVVLRGYFQDRANVFPHLDELTEAVARAAGNVHELTGASTAIHVRRGDYVSEPSTTAFHGNLDLDYYEEALGHQVQEDRADWALVYSDDLDYASNQFAPELERRLPGLRVTVRDTPEADPLAELEYLARHESHIIANSTFSWWAATLSGSNSVIGPRQWWASSAAPDANGLRWPEWTWI